ncbi:Ig-like domain-containing protein [Filimonas effusa]|uniref:T9SS type B sorting domain-containing protein n=1 Tax=Filimonas effusa TaxID=2508721 RepID=A0A4Q1D903_9BACT|nr:gliding motility-associated C-terminal domain-containing protein [Filimonas effusa]RXK85832.1 T9SS type B sorting domain-containing protein [Filimonas effusa]
MGKIYLESSFGSLRKLFIAILLLGFAGEKALAQTPLYFKNGGTATTSTIPLNQTSQKTQLLYAPADFSTTPISGYLTKIYFRGTVAEAIGTYSDLKISFLQTADLSFPSTSFYTGLTPALSRTTFTVQGSATAGGWFVIPLETPYLYDNTKSLIVEIQYTAVSGGISTNNNTSTGNKRCSGTSLTNTTGTTGTAWNDFGMDVLPAAACTSAPVPGTVSYTSVVGCAGRPLQFVLQDHGYGAGISFQWQSATSLSGPYTNVGGALSSSLFETTAPSGTSYFRCAVTCGGNTSYSDVVTVISREALPSGTYTIDKNTPTAGTNFNSFKDVATVLSCAGITGSVVFDVVPGSGPYEEQFTLPQITGASATSTITFNGNDNILRYNGVTAARHVIELDGADYITFRKFNIVTQNATYGWGIHLTNEANYNTIDSCTIDVSTTTSTTAANSAGITVSGSSSSVTTASSASNNTITNNTIIGGYTGIILYGTATSQNAVNNIIRNNKVMDFYGVGIEIANNNGALIENNDISRAARGAVYSGFEGVTMGTGNINCVVNANRIHDTHTIASSQSGSAYGVYSTACDAPAGSENKVTNNLIYNFNSSTGIIYGIYNSSSDGVFYYHNTIVLDNASSTAGATRGIYQTTAASRIAIKNNVVDIRRGGTGIKHAIFMGTATTTYESDYNNFYINAPAGTNYAGCVGTTNYASLANWKTGSGKDANSIEIALNYQNAALGDYMPVLPLAADNKGTPLGVTLDILGANRSASTPDIGAYEFVVTPCTNPPDAGTLSTDFNPICSGKTFTLVRDGGSAGTGQTYQWESSADNATWSAVPGATGLSLSRSQTQTTWYRLVVTCGVAVPTPAIEIVTPTGMQGNFTIDKTRPTSSSNFKSFNDAYSAIQCGISGAVVFDVAAGSGPYEEQLVMQEIPGSSANNTVTFNGNGNTISFISVNSNERAVIKLNGTDHVIFDNLIISTQGTTTSQYGWGIQLLNSADSNIIRNCTILSSTESTSSSNYAGIVIGGSASSATATGDPNCDNNIIDKNTIVGGYYGLTMVASGASAFNSWNKITRNDIKDFYYYGIYVNGSFEALIDSNTISRPSRTSVSTFNGVYLTSPSAKAVISRNTITNPFGGNPTSTSVTNGIYFSGADALAGRENVVVNNLIYNLTGKGSVNAIYNSSSDLALYYHNTIHIDGATDVTASFARAFYQTTEALDIQFKNNMITFSRNTIGEKHAIYLNTPTSTIQSDRNNIYFYPNSGAGATYMGFRVNNVSTLAEWKALGFDANSTSNDPLYIDITTGNFEPSNASINNHGLPVVPPVTVDLRGTARDAATPDAGAFEFSPPVCITPPTAGTIVMSDNPACENSLVTLSLNGNSTGEGQTYQWQTSSSLNGTYTAISNVLTNPAFTITATETAYFRAAITCSGNTAYTTPIQLIVTPAFPGGTYTIDANEPASATNFTSFAAVREALLCGISDAVVFNVAAGGAPYNEQIRFDSIPGTSATNTITFNGNGNTIRFSSSNSNQRAVITLSQTDYITFNNFVIDATGTGTYGWGVFLTRDADNNTFRNCSILLPTNSTSSNFAGVVISSSVTGATVSGATLCDNNLFENNTITGGYYGMTMMGLEALPSSNNRFIRNKLMDVYFYGIYVGQTADALIQGNQISRATRATTSDFYGIYSTGISANLQITGNRIFNPFGGNATATNITYPIYITANDAEAGTPTRITNNLIYNLNGAGTTYGIYNSSSNNVKYYHNTISLDNTSNTLTSASYGLYQTGAADGLDVKNNIISITRGGSGANYGLYFLTATTEFASDYNNVFVNGAGTGANNFGYHGGVRASLADWQTYSSGAKDMNSQTVDPVFAGPGAGNFVPQQVAINDRGTPVGVTNDIELQARSTTTPDPGAYEYDVSVCTSPPTAGVATVTPPSGICLGESVVLNLTGNSSGGSQRYIWQKGASATATAWTVISDSLYNPGFEYKLETPESFFRCIVVCSGISDTSDIGQVVLNPLMLAGDYTIDPAVPQSATNFQSFTAAVDALKCGVAGHIRFHVTPGTYTEQVRLTKMPNMSANSTVTFMSQNGDPASVILTYANSTTTNNYVVQFDNSSYFILKGITVTASTATYSHAVEFTGEASNDSLVNCTINLPAVTSTATGVAAVYGASLSGNHLVIKGNTITNGSSGIYLSGMTTVSPDSCVVDSNIIKGVYYYSVYLANITNVHVNKNVITKGGILNTTTYGIYATNCDSAYQINNNDVEIYTSGTTVYGIYLTGCQTSQQARASITNNKIIAGDDNTGNQYGLYMTTTTLADIRNNVISVNTKGATSYGIYQNSGSTGGFLYHNNTVQSKATSTTNNVAVHIGQTSSSSAGPTYFHNNIFSHLGGGTAFSIASYAVAYSDYNMLYSSGSTLIANGANLYPALQAWRDASLADYNSIVYEPALTGAALTPDVANPNVWAIHGRGVQIEGNDADINGNPRPTTLAAGVPDLGAYEFVPTAVPVLLTATPATPAPNTTQTFMLGTDTVTSIKWGATVPATVEGRRYSGVMPPNLAAGQPYMYFYTDFDFTGATPAAHTVEQVYLDSWRGLIETEEEINLGRTNTSNVWETGANSTVQVLRNIITEANLGVLDKFTGLTDGPAIVPPVTINPSDSSNTGTKFWVGYGHYQDFATANAQEMVLYLAAASSPATVTVRINGTSWVKQYTVAANSVIVSDFIPKFGLNDARLMKEGLSERGISIESDMPITAYAHIYGNTSSGATMLMPVGTYGYEYYALTSKQHYATVNTYSWFYVVAAYDSTVVEITPSQPTLNGRAAGQTYTVNLKKGQVYQVLGAMSNDAFGYDLTGSRIKSVANSAGKCYPVAVFSGSSRTNIGCGDAQPVNNGDNIIQQNFPYKAWGRRYLTAATSHADAADQLNGNLFKVVVKDPTTVVKRNGTVLTNLIDNFYYQIETNGADYIEADKPIMVAQFMPSAASTNGCGYTGNGDPEMIYLSPIEQGIKSVRLYRNTRYNITVQYLTLIIPANGVNSLTVDGNNTFDYVYDHPNLAGYKVVVKRWTATAAQTVVQSDSAFTAITYGLGSAESYGYNAGTLVLDLNTVSGIRNVHSPSTSNSEFTCAGTPFKFNFLSSVEPTSIEWQLNTVAGLLPNNTNVIQANPVATGTVIINGVTYYQYSLPTEYNIDVPGVYKANVFITHPSLEGCSRLETALPITVFETPKPDFSVTGNCLGGPVQFAGSVDVASSDDSYSWRWDFKDGGATAATQNASHTFSATGTYNVDLSIITKNGCIADTTKAVTIGAAPAVVLVEDSLAVCSGSTATFSVQSPVANTTYNWYDAATGGTLVHTGNSWTTPGITGPANYWVESVQNGCISDNRADAKAVILPELVMNTPVVDSAGANLLIFRWDAVPQATGYEVSTNGGSTWVIPSSGATGTTHTVTALVVNQTVTLQVRALGGCLPAVSQAVSGTTVSDQIFIPNAFTPNNRGDVENEKLKVYSNVIRQLNFMIFNQWGQKVFETRDQAVGWDGNFKGKPQPSGVYIYVADIILTDGRRVQRKGVINLIR